MYLCLTRLVELPDYSKCDLMNWLNPASSCPINITVPRSIKNIDTRTFTRPKKRLFRPSIEKYNEELYAIDFNGAQSGESSEATPTKPLNFDLAEGNASLYFENIMNSAPMHDSFQNMSPPSLVNSMCSSTFANLMENSYIKNDPVLREISDTDFTESILQETEQPLYHSMTGSCSSLNSDVPENFLKKLSFNETFRKKAGSDATFNKYEHLEANIQNLKAGSDATFTKYDLLEENSLNQSEFFFFIYIFLPQQTF